MEEYRDLTKLIAGIDAGTKIELEVIRGGKVRVIDVTIGRMPGEDLAMSEARRGGRRRAAHRPVPDAADAPRLRAERGLDADAAACWWPRSRPAARRSAPASRPAA
jgi:hypothetical protein